MDKRTRLCVIGLGNPGARYKNTRHNIGFDWIDAVIQSNLFSSQSPKVAEKFDALWWQGSAEEKEIHFLKPQTFMNESGKVLTKWSSKYQGLSEILIVMDDMDLPLGKLRIREHGGDGGHRGLRSILNHAQGKEVPRLRIGIGRAPENSIDHVLQKFKPDEKIIVKKCLDDAPHIFKDLLTTWFCGERDKALNIINSKNYGAVSSGS